MQLLLFMSFGGSLTKWQREGILSREIELYVEHLRRGNVDEVLIYTYSHDDQRALEQVDCGDMIRSRITLVPPRRKMAGKLGALLHSFDLIQLWRLRRRASLSKTNQVSGSWPAIILTWMGVPLFARCGYLLSRRLEKNGDRKKAMVARALDFIFFNSARIVSVTTDAAKDTVQSVLMGRGTRVFTSPTYVNTELFQSDAAAKRDDGIIIFVGRLEPQKNVHAIVDACHRTGMKLVIVGDGSLREAVKSQIDTLGMDAAIIPRAENTAIAHLYRKHRFFILASVHEGLPKALIEAMSAEMTCIGTHVPGISDLITDGETGFLSPTLDAGALADTIIRARADGQKAVAVAKAARQTVLNRHSIATYVQRERDEMDAALAR
ncbi:MAG: glycosyltransferase family 4 protein [Beijerinckiaceae bacterium]